VKVCETIADLRTTLEELRLDYFRKTQQQPRIGFVPTMGYLHQGHASLLKQARSSCDLVVLSIFVNPLQFAAGEDLDIYPRDPDADIRLAATHDVDLVWMPMVAQLYPNGNPLTMVRVSQVTERLCGASRPGHFDGVATVVSKLFHLVQPDQAFFGLKDAQQVAVIEQMVADLNIPVEIVACPTVREQDGIALSSRNVYLNEQERRAATVLHRSLSQIDEWLIDQPHLTFSQLSTAVRNAIAEEPLARIDYVECLHYPTFAPIDELSCTTLLEQEENRVLVAVAVYFGRTRLIDNRLIGGGHRV
jgi:pantoate--beta-alanine ligase